MRHFALALSFIGIVLFSVSCGEDKSAGPSEPSMIVPGGSVSPDLVSSVDPFSLSVEEVVALAGAAGKANTSCRQLDDPGWRYYGSGDPAYWYVWGVISGDQCAEFSTGYEWKVRVLMKNIGRDGATYTVSGPNGAEWDQMALSRRQVGDTGWQVKSKGTFKVAPAPDGAGVMLVAARITETWNDTD